MMFKVGLLVLVCYFCQVQGYGYRYNFNPGSGETNLWTFLPGNEQPTVYAYGAGQQWPQIYSVNYEGLIPGDPVHSSFIREYNSDDATLYKYKGADGQFKYKCKTDAYYSEYLRKCVWRPGTPGYYNRVRPQKPLAE